MKLLFKIFIWFILSIKIATAQDVKNYKVILEYKAYWAGFVVSDISSEAVLTSDEYQIAAHYEVSGIAALFRESINDTMSTGIRLENGEFRPKTYESRGNFGEFNI